MIFKPAIATINIKVYITEANMYPLSTLYRID